MFGVGTLTSSTKGPAAHGKDSAQRWLTVKWFAINCGLGCGCARANQLCSSFTCEMFFRISKRLGFLSWTALRNRQAYQKAQIDLLYLRALARLACTGGLSVELRRSVSTVTETRSGLPGVDSTQRRSVSSYCNTQFRSDQGMSCRHHYS